MSTPCWPTAMPSPTWRRATSGPRRPSTTSSAVCVRAPTSSRRRCTRSTTRARRPPEWVDRLTAAAEEGGATLLVSGVDPGWGNDALAVIAAGLCTRIRSIHCQEIFDYSTYDQPYAVKVLLRLRWLDGRGADDAAAVRPDDGVGRQHSADRPRAGAGDRRDHRGSASGVRWKRRSTPSWGSSRRAPRVRSGSRSSASRAAASGSSSTTSPASTRPARRIGRSPTRARATTASSSTATPSSPWSAGPTTRRHQGRRRQHDGREPSARRHRMAGDAEAGHLRRARRTSSPATATRGGGAAVGKRLVFARDGLRLLLRRFRLGQLTHEILGEPPDGRIVEYRGRVDRERAAELTVQPVAEFDRHQ